MLIFLKYCFIIKQRGVYHTKREKDRTFLFFMSDLVLLEFKEIFYETDY